MRLGAPVFGYKNAAQWAALHVQHGYGAAYWPLALDAPITQVQEYRDAAQQCNLVISEIGAWNNLLEKNPLQQAKNVARTIAALRLADAIGAKCCINITGSLSDTWDGPHPEQMSEQTLHRVVPILQHIIDTAAPQHTYYTVEPMPWMYPNSIETMQQLLELVNRPRFAVHADMCNLINSFDKVYTNAADTRAFFNAFGNRIKAVHAKDILLSNKLTLQLYETIPGDGLMDCGILLQACAQLDLDLPVMAEHLDTEQQYRRATQYLQQKAHSMGLALQTARLERVEV